MPNKFSVGSCVLKSMLDYIARLPLEERLLVGENSVLVAPKKNHLEDLLAMALEWHFLAPGGDLAHYM